jgi:hypothetical protein
VTYPLWLVESALHLRSQGLTQQQVADALGVSRSAVRDWIARPDFRRERLALVGDHASETCSLIHSVDHRAYAYLLGQYLGDGCISAMGPRGVYRLRIATCDDYLDIRQRTIDAMSSVMPRNKVGVTQDEGCSEVSSYSKHWPCLFPQHGPGKKHLRKIELEEWQLRIIEVYPHELLTGLIHSDGCRVVNRIKKNGKVYEYPRYFFCNSSADIRNIFTATCESIGISCNQNRWNSISIARSEDVAYLDAFIGPKT